MKLIPYILSFVAFGLILGCSPQNPIPVKNKVSKSDLSISNEIDVLHKGVKFGMTTKEVSRLLNVPITKEIDLTSQEEKGKIDDISIAKNLEYKFINDILVFASISLSKESHLDYQTQKGIGFSSSIKNIIDKYGVPTLSNQSLIRQDEKMIGGPIVYSNALELLYQDEGLSFYINENEVSIISIYGLRSEFEKVMKEVQDKSKEDWWSIEKDLKWKYKIIQNPLEFNFSDIPNDGVSAYSDYKINPIPDTAKPDTAKENQDKDASPKRTIQPNGWNVYHNDRYNFSIQYPSEWVAGEESDNGDGKVLYIGNPDVDIRVYASHYLEGISDPYQSKNKSMNMQKTKLANGNEAVLVTGKVDNKVLYNMVFISKDEIVYHFYAEVSEKFFQANETTLLKVAKSLSP